MHTNHMTTGAGIPTQTLARMAGALYLTIIVAGIFAHFFVRGSLIVPGDAGTTAANIVAAEARFRSGIAGDLVMILADVALAVALYILLKPVSNGLSLLAAFFRLTQAAILGMNLLNLFLALQLVNGAGYLAVLGAEQRNAQALFFLNAHTIGYAIALVFFGMSLFVLSYLILKSGYLPKLLALLLMFAGVGYMVDSFASFFLPSYGDYATLFALIVFLPAIVAELSLCLWLLLKGVKRPHSPLQPSSYAV